MGIETAPLPGRNTWIYGTTLCLGWRVDWVWACDFSSAWRTVGLARRRHRHPRLPEQRHVYFTVFLDSVNIRKPQPAMRWTVLNQGEPALGLMAHDMSHSAQYC